jgi:hypothetical protein
VGLRPRFRSSQTQPTGTYVNARAALLQAEWRQAAILLWSAGRFQMDSTWRFERRLTPRSQVPPIQSRDSYVLVRNLQSRWANLVNRYGFPARKVRLRKEKHGLYILRYVHRQEVHFRRVPPTMPWTAVIQVGNSAPMRLYGALAERS